MRYTVRVNGRPVAVEVDGKGGSVSVDGRPLAADLRRIRGEGAWTLRLGERVHCVGGSGNGSGGTVTVGARVFRVEVEDEREAAAHAVRPADAGGPRVLRSAMPGIVREVLVAEGEAVAAKQPLLVLEAMKMQNEVRADRAGTVARIHAAPGTTVARGDPLVTMV